jgi:hypothetical protein
LDGLPKLTVHSEPTISGSPISPKFCDELGELAIVSLVSGLVAALLLPYLMELAFPPRRGRISKPDSVDTL